MNSVISNCKIQPKKPYDCTFQENKTPALPNVNVDKQITINSYFLFSKVLLTHKGQELQLWQQQYIKFFKTISRKRFFCIRSFTSIMVCRQFPTFLPLCESRKWSMQRHRRLSPQTKGKNATTSGNPVNG